MLVENKRLGDLDKIAADYAKLLAAERDELVAKVTTAVVRTARARVAAGGGGHWGQSGGEGGHPSLACGGVALRALCARACGQARRTGR